MTAATRHVVKLYSFDAQAANETVPSLKGKVSDAEWQQRVDLAAFYRLAHHLGWDDLLFTHISARVPGEENHFLINPIGYLYDELTASHLVKVDANGNKVDDTPLVVNPTGFLIHGAIFTARPDVNWVMHAHVADIIAVSCQEQGLLPLTEHTAFVGRVSYHDWLPPVRKDVTAKLAADLGNANVMLLRNHGSITVGGRPGDCFYRMRFLANACTFQVRAQSTGAAMVLPDQTGMADLTAATDEYDDSTLTMAWYAMRRLADRLDASYAS